MWWHYFCKSCTVYDLYSFVYDICHIIPFVYKKNMFPHFSNDGYFKFNTKHAEACFACQDENRGFHSKQGQESKQFSSCALYV